MSFYRLWIYVARCAMVSCRRSANVESNGTEEPTPAVWARGELRAEGWTLVSRGNRLGWEAYCPEHPQVTTGRRASG